MWKDIKAVAIAIVGFFINGCDKDKDDPKVDVKSLIMGKWKLVQFKQDNQPWKDSTGTFYNFISDTLVSTKIRTFECDRRYDLEYSTAGLKQVSINANFSCLFIYWNSFSVVRIDNTSMEITYPDEVGGLIVRKNEKYIKE
jgi:hypothetical protein